MLRSIKTLLVALGVCVGGIFFGLVGARAASQVYGMIAAHESPTGLLLSIYLVQPGMGLFALGYLWFRKIPSRFFRIRSLSTEDTGWVLLGTFAYWAITTQVLRPVLQVAGLQAANPHEGDRFLWEPFLEHPEVALLALFVMPVMATAEETVYRGIVHGELHRSFGTATRTILGSLLFGFMHAFTSSGLTSWILVGIGWLPIAAAYERTDNLLVPILIHIGIWLVVTPMSL